MPSVRFSRDKRGYEYVYLVHTPTRRGKPGRTRVLYWYRTPPGVRIGRKPFDEEVQRTLEQQNPGVTFDWEAIIGTPMPPPDMTEFWRERRRAEKAARQERRAMEAEEAGATHEQPRAGVEAVVVGTAGAETSVEGAPPGDAPTADTAEAASLSSAARKRRRRRGRRRTGQGDAAVDPAGESPSEESASASEDLSDDDSGETSA